MPAYIDARPPGLDLTFLRGTARNQPILFPAGTLAGRTFTATLDGVGLSVGIVADTLTVSVTVAQTNAAAAGPLPFVLTETTGVDQPYVIGTWRASTRPSTVTPSQTLTLVVNNETVTLLPISGAEFPELVAGDPAEVDLATVAGVTTLSLLDTVARKAWVHKPGEYYWSVYGTSAAQTLTQNNLILAQVILSAGTIDRIGVDVSTAVATGVIRLGIYADNGGLPFNLIAEAASTADGGTTGIKDLTISASIPKNGVYWVACVGQVVAGMAIQGGPSSTWFPLSVPLGTTAQGGTSNFATRLQAGVTGALPSTLTGLSVNPQSARARVHYRYSA